MLSVTALWTHTKASRSERKLENRRAKQRARSHRAAVASWFFRLGELGSVDRALAASSSLLDDMEMVFRLETTCVWSSLDWRRKIKQTDIKQNN